MLGKSPVKHGFQSFGQTVPDRFRPFQTTGMVPARNEFVELNSVLIAGATQDWLGGSRETVTGHSHSQPGILMHFQLHLLEIEE
jgi:hypothetical protein